MNVYIHRLSHMQNYESHTLSEVLLRTGPAAKTITVSFIHPENMLDVSSMQA